VVHFTDRDDCEINWGKVKEKARDPRSDISKAFRIVTRGKQFIVLDTETTGFCANRGDKMIEVAFQKYYIRNDELREGDVFQSYVDPERFIPYNITNLTRITNEDVQNKPVIEELLPDIIRFIGKSYVVGHNVAFDLRFLHREMDEAGYDRFKGKKIVDTVKISRQMYGRERKHKLLTCARREGIERFSKEHYHSALHDVQVTAGVFFSMLKKIARGLE